MIGLIRMLKRMDTNVINLIKVGFDCLSDLDTWIRMLLI